VVNDQSDTSVSDRKIFKAFIIFAVPVTEDI
jgi:hypothetical protein